MCLYLMQFSLKGAAVSLATNNHSPGNEVRQFRLAISTSKPNSSQIESGSFATLFPEISTCYRVVKTEICYGMSVKPHGPTTRALSDVTCGNELLKVAASADPSLKTSLYNSYELRALSTPSTFAGLRAVSPCTRLNSRLCKCPCTVLMFSSTFTTSGRAYVRCRRTNSVAAYSAKRWQASATL